MATTAVNDRGEAKPMNERSSVSRSKGATDGRFRVTCWGDFSVFDAMANAAANPRGRKSRALLAYLVLHPAKKVSRERLTALLWGDRAEEQARASLRQALVELKPFASSQPPLLVVERDGVSLEPSALTTDIDELRKLIDEGAFAEFLSTMPEPSDCLFANLDNIDDDFDDWLAIERTRQGDILVALISQGLTAALGAGERSLAHSLETRLLEIDPGYQIDRRPEALQIRTPRVGTSPSSAAFPQYSGHRRIALILAPVLILLLIGTWLYFSPNVASAPKTIAVLPFKDLSNQQDPGLADGIAEEIMTRLSHDPGQRVIGRTSVWAFADARLDTATIGQRLNASYLVEGTVRSANNQVRVDVSLVQAKSGARLWTEQFSGSIDDIFGIQDRIGDAISQRLKTRLPHARDREPRGDAYVLYVTARGLIHSREDSKVDVAIDMLRQAVKLDPAYPPAWASLGRALIFRARYQPDALSESINSPEAVGYIRRAIMLQPSLAEAHLALGMTLGPGEERKAEFERAVALDPNNAEAWNAVALEHRFRGDYVRELAAWRQAVRIEPLWFRAFFNASETAWNLGYRSEAAQYARKASTDEPNQPFTAQMIRSDMAMRRGDYSQSLAASNEAFKVSRAGGDFYAQLARARALRAMGDFGGARDIWPFYRVDDVMWRMWHNRAPTPQEVGSEIRNPRIAWSDEANIAFRLATLLNANRAREAAALYDAKFHSPAEMASRMPFGHAAFVRDSALVILALRARGRTVEAQRMADLAEAAVRKTLSLGRVPCWYYSIAAQLWAVAGRRNESISALEHAANEGWFYGAERDSFSDLAFEPAFASLRGEPRFQRLRSHFLRHAERERDESNL